MPFIPENTPGDQAQATVQSVLPQTQLKVEQTRENLRRQRQAMQITAVVGENGEHLGEGKKKKRKAGKSATEKAQS